MRCLLRGSLGRQNIPTNIQCRLCGQIQDEGYEEGDLQYHIHDP